jgi:predicted  nucleic acid-binding Zn-ribbon protein
MNTKNEVFEYLIDQLRQQVSSNLYKQQCEDLAHEVLSLKNQLRDASALVAELQEELGASTNTVVRLRKEIAKYTGDTGEYIDATEQSGCSKDDTRECEHDWYWYSGSKERICRKCGEEK